MGFFDSRYKFGVHILQIMLVLATIGVSVVRLFMSTNNASSRGRANTMALGVGAKSLIFIGYQLLTEHVAKFHRWASLKANMIMNCLEVVFWGAVVFLIIQGVLQNGCMGTTCILSWVVAGLGAVLNVVANWTAIVSVMEFRKAKAERKSNDNKNFHGLEPLP